MFTITGVKTTTTITKKHNVVYSITTAQKIVVTYDDNRNRVSSEIIATLEDSPKRLGVDDSDDFSKLSAGDSTPTYQNDSAYHDFLDIIARPQSWKYAIDYKRDKMKPIDEKNKWFIQSPTKCIDAYRMYGNDVDLFFAGLATVKCVLRCANTEYSRKLQKSLVQIPFEMVTYDGVFYDWKFREWSKAYEVPHDAYQLVIEAYYAYREWLAVYGIDEEIVINERIYTLQRYAFARVEAFAEKQKSYHDYSYESIESLTEKGYQFDDSQKVKHLEEQGHRIMLERDEVFIRLLGLLPQRTIKMLSVYLASGCDRKATARALEVSDDVIQGLFRRLRKTLENNDISIDDFDCYGFKTAGDSSKIDVTSYVTVVAKSRDVDALFVRKALEWKRKARKQSMETILKECSTKESYIDTVLAQYAKSLEEKTATKHENVRVTKKALDKNVVAKMVKENRARA